MGSSKTFPLCAAMIATLTGCYPSLSESDAIFYGYCVGIFPGAEVAIERGYLQYQPGTFQRVQEIASRSFPVPINWDEESFSIFQREIRRGQNHGGAILRGDVQRSDIARLNACIEWASGLQ
ncbi:hypothetical protein [Nioella ostreopsis]|uniref:hypothetical protein n=1 Tax=Nioella ostreopsis TaxID=2448479 RepID=UPI000FD73BB3|nr:hypothetical protein [Nioella ostreopsis]